MPTTQAITCLSGTLLITKKLVNNFVKNHAKCGYTESLKIIENQEETRKTKKNHGKTKKHQEKPRKPRKNMKNQENHKNPRKPRKNQ